MYLWREDLRFNEEEGGLIVDEQEVGSRREQSKNRAKVKHHQRGRLLTSCHQMKAAHSWLLDLSEGTEAAPLWFGLGLGPYDGRGLVLTSTTS